MEAGAAPVALHVEEEQAEQEMPGRSSAFRRQVLESYDHHCVACGLRIRIAQHGLTFVDAAHLMPFSVTRNDHPSNGLALCKNHHWALDQSLIAPDPDGIWRISPCVQPRRSHGEEELARLAGTQLLPPSDPAFAPRHDALEWRYTRLLS